VVLVNGGVLFAVAVEFLMGRERKKLLSCLFFDDVFCSFRKSEKSGIMNRCFKCPHYLRFLRFMEEEEEEFWDEVDRIREYGYPKGFRELKSGESGS
jgi:hypothetical protein